MPLDTDLYERTNQAAVLGELKELPAWQALSEIVQDRKEKHFTSLSKQLMAGTAVDQRYIDRMAGYFKGMEDLLKYPDLADKRLKSALTRAELLKEGDTA